jgi:hypothetical protein
MALHAIILAADPAIGSDLDFIVVCAMLGACGCLAISILIFTPRAFKDSFGWTFKIWSTAVAIAAVTTYLCAPAFWYTTKPFKAVSVCRWDGLCRDTCSTTLETTLLRGGQNDQAQPVWWTMLIDPKTYANKTNPVLLDYGSPVDLTDLSTQIAQLHHVDDDYQPGLTSKSCMLIIQSTALQWTLYNFFKAPRVARNDIVRVHTMNKASSHKRSRIPRTLLCLIKLILFFVWPLQYAYLLVFSCVSRKRRLPDMETFLSQWVPIGATPKCGHTKEDVRGARAMATYWYIIANLRWLAWPALFMYHIITLEWDLYVMQYSEQESLHNVGQWTPLVTIVLTVLATTCYHIVYPPPKVHDIWVLQETKKPPECERPSLCGLL